MEDEDVSWVGYPPLKFLAKAHGIGRLSDPGGVDLSLKELVRGEERMKDTYFESDEREHSRKLFFTIFEGLGVPLVPLLVSLVDQSIYLGEYLVSCSSPCAVGTIADLGFQVLLNGHLIFNIR